MNEEDAFLEFLKASPSLDWIIAILAFVACLILVYLGIKRGSESRLIETYVAADSIKSIPIDIPVIINGSISASNPLTSPITKKPCIYFKVLLEKWEGHSKSGDTWTTIGSPQVAEIPFYLKDATGRILVKPDGAEIQGESVYQNYLIPGTIKEDNLPTFEKIVKAAVSNPESDNYTERVTEKALFLSSNINIFGRLSLEGDTQFFQTTKEYPLIITTKSKEQLTYYYRWREQIYFLGSFLLVGIALYFIAIIFHWI